MLVVGLVVLCLCELSWKLKWWVRLMCCRLVLLLLSVVIGILVVIWVSVFRVLG